MRDLLFIPLIIPCWVLFSTLKLPQYGTTKLHINLVGTHNIIKSWNASPLCGNCTQFLLHINMHINYCCNCTTSNAILPIPTTGSIIIQSSWKWNLNESPWLDAFWHQTVHIFWQSLVGSDQLPSETDHWN